MQYYILENSNSSALKEVSHDELPESVRMKLTPEGLREAARTAAERQINDSDK